MKKTYFQIILYLSATFFIYGHSGYPVLLAMYIIPLFTSCAFSKSAVRRSVWFSTFFIIFYAAIKTYCTSSTYFITLSLVVELLVLLSSLIAFNVNNQYHEAVKGLINAMKYSDELIYKVHTDSVTGAFSREKLEVDLNNFLFKSIAFLDLDDFKKVNDIYGHNMGDWVLNTLVTCLNESKIRIYRYGGDEFLIASILTPVELKELLNYKIENFKYQTNLQLGEPVTVSCGIILSDKFSRDDIQKADEVMYSVKKASKNNIKVIE
jgi:diguanylate cyclase (GGDEF)-like protein